MEIAKYGHWYAKNADEEIWYCQMGEEELDTRLVPSPSHDGDDG